MYSNVYGKFKVYRKFKKVLLRLYSKYLFIPAAPLMVVVALSVSLAPEVDSIRNGSELYSFSALTSHPLAFDPFDGQPAHFYQGGRPADALLRDFEAKIAAASGDNPVGTLELPLNTDTDALLSWFLSPSWPIDEPRERLALIEEQYYNNITQTEVKINQLVTHQIESFKDFGIVHVTRRKLSLDEALNYSPKNLVGRGYSYSVQLVQEIKEVWYKQMGPNYLLLADFEDAFILCLLLGYKNKFTPILYKDGVVWEIDRAGENSLRLAFLPGYHEEGKKGGIYLEKVHSTTSRGLGAQKFQALHRIYIFEPCSIELEKKTDKSKLAQNVRPIGKVYGDNSWIDYHVLELIRVFCAPLGMFSVVDKFEARHPGEAMRQMWKHRTQKLETDPGMPQKAEGPELTESIAKVSSVKTSPAFVAFGGA